MKTILEIALNHPWTYASVDSVARSVVSPGWDIVPVKRYQRGATEIQRKKLESFFEYSARDWNNIKDFQSFEDKMYWTIASRRLIGSAAWEIIRNSAGVPIGFDVLAGVTVPLTDNTGKFLSPAFEFHPWHSNDIVSYERDEIIYFCELGISGSPFGESVYTSLLNSSLPSDMFASVAYRSMFENTNAPYNGVWEVDAAVSDEDFDMFLALLEERYTGPTNFGRNPLVIRGGVNYKPVTSRTREDAPYLEGRSYNRSELSAVTGVDGNKMGVSDDANKSNIRETQREFQTNVTVPTAKKIEADVYYQVCSRLFGYEGWMFKFRQAGSTTPLEQASIDMRNLQFGIYSPNEVRAQHGDDPRKGGDIYYVPGNSQSRENSDGESANGRATSTKPSEGHEEPKTPPARPPRDDDAKIKAIDAVSDLRKWKKITLEYMDGKRSKKQFTSGKIPTEIVAAIESMLSEHEGDFDFIKSVFDTAIEAFRGGENES